MLYVHCEHCAFFKATYELEKNANYPIARGVRTLLLTYYFLQHIMHAQKSTNTNDTSEKH